MWKLYRLWCGGWEFVREYSTEEAAQYTMHCHLATGIPVRLDYEPFGQA